MQRLLFFVLGFATLTPYVTSAMALIAGIIVGVIFGNPYPTATRRWTTPLMQICIVGLGAEMNLQFVARVGIQGLGYTATGIALTLIIGWGLGRFFRVEKETTVLIASGTAICGGSAIAAVSAAIGAVPQHVSVSLVTVFLLNAVALFIFPTIGHQIGLTENQFGLWSGLAIHDTSSVVGAALQYGPEALRVATTVKLARALWIVPLTWVIVWLWRRGTSQESRAATKRPWFILYFILMAALVTWVPALEAPGVWLAKAARRGMVLALFLIGCGLSRATLRQTGFRPLLQGTALWILVSAGTLGAILIGWIK